MDQETDLPNYHGCLNLLHAIYTLWWRDALRDPATLKELAAWTDQPVPQVRRRPLSFRSNRKSDLLPDD